MSRKSFLTVCYVDTNAHRLQGRGTKDVSWFFFFSFFKDRQLPSRPKVIISHPSRRRRQVLTCGCFFSSSLDATLNEAARILRLLHVEELRELQTRINEAIVAVQAIIADPKTDHRLGKVGRWSSTRATEGTERMGTGRSLGFSVPRFAGWMKFKTRRDFRLDLKNPICFGHVEKIWVAQSLHLSLTVYSFLQSIV